LAVGGGTKNEPWLQATSDLTGLDQIVCSVTTGASYGNAFWRAWRWAKRRKPTLRAGTQSNASSMQARNFTAPAAMPLMM
jgi:sugar (pentulose or hexulose) kinase